MAEGNTTRGAGSVPSWLAAVSLLAVSILAACAESSSVATTTRQPVTTGDPSSVSNAEGDLVLGVFPFLPARRIDEIYGPLAVRMSDDLGRVVHLRTASSFASFSEKLAQFDFDVALVQPLDHLVLIAQGYQPVARVEQPLVATVVALPGLEIEPSFSSLVPLRIGTPPVGSAIRRLVEAELLAAGENPTTMDLMSYTTHQDCLEQLLLEAIDVCATAPVPLREFEQDFGRQLAVVVESRPIASISYVAKPTLDADTVAELRTFFLGLDEDPDAASILASVGTDRYVEIEAGDYDTVQALLAESSG